MHLKLLLVAFAAVVLGSCTVVNGPKVDTTKTQLQIREIQTREFDTNDVKLVMKALVNVLQDDGFVVKNAVTELGLITAMKELQISGRSTGSSGSSDALGDILERLFRSSSSGSTTTAKQEARFDKFKVVEVSVNISEIGTRTKVRANFQAKILDNQGQPSSIFVIDDPKFYQDFFVRVDKGIFIQRQGL